MQVLSVVELEFQSGMDIMEAEKLFHVAFPNLRLEIIRQHHKNNGFHFVGLKNHGTPEVPCELKFDGDTSVKAFISGIKFTFGLDSIVYRLTGHTWIPVTSTEDWSLAEQNNETINFR